MNKLLFLIFINIFCYAKNIDTTNFELQKREQIRLFEKASQSKNDNIKRAAKYAKHCAENAHDGKGLQVCLRLYLTDALGMIDESWPHMDKDEFDKRKKIFDLLES